MVLKSEGDKLKHCSSPPRNRKYVTVAFTTLVCERFSSFQDNSLQSVVSSLLELNYKPTDAPNFQSATSVQGSAENMLVEAAIDQTFAFQRTSHIQLHHSQPEL